MMRALVGLAICLAGCWFEPGRAGEDDDDDGSGMGSGSGSGSAQDTDGDGVSDLTDNCLNVGNADQRDHDGDAIGDTCDVCPHVIDIGKDTDLDGVGDKCDPRPSTAGDRLAFFEGFYDPPTWDPVIGANTWQLTSGALRQQSLTSEHQLVRDDEPNLGRVFVDARVRIDAVSTNASTRRSTGIVLAYRDAKHFLFCGLAAGAAPQTAEVNAGHVTTDFLGFEHYNYTPGTFPAQMAGDWLTLQARTMPADWGNTRVECVGHRAGATGTAAYEGDADLDGDIGIRTNSTDASFDYVFVVAVGA